MIKSKFLINVINIYRKVDSLIKKFLYTDYYLILVCAIVFFGWYSRCAPFGFTAAVVIACIALLFADDILPLTVNLFSAVLIIYSQDFADYTYLWPLAIPLGICFIVFLIKNGKHDFHLGKMFFPLMAVAYALLIGGCGYATKSDLLKSLPDILMIGISIPVIYIVANHYLKRDDKRDIPLYFSKTMMYIGLVICLELIVSLIQRDLPISQWHTSNVIIKGSNRNDTATYLIFTAGMTMYLSTRYRQGWLFLAIGLFQYLCLVMTFSRGAIIFGALSGVFAFALTIIKAPNKKLHLLYIAVTAVAILLLYLILRKDINEMIDSLLDRGMTSNSRLNLFKEAWALFKAHPIFGVGKGYVGVNTHTNGMDVYWFHSTVFQVLACTGIVGLVAYIYYYLVRFKILFANFKYSFNLFVLAVWVGFEGYSLINTGTFIAYPFMALVIVMTLLLERTQQDFSGYVSPYNCITPLGKKIAQADGFKAYLENKKQGE
ncbi:MAG: O-antigen ligase family protein [Clostridia bacterium]|nr:O-antigen ligase family protein [Clostridia bacterium]